MRARTGWALLAVLTLTLLVGCGRSEGPLTPPTPTVGEWDQQRDPAALLTDAGRLLAGADSVRLVGSGTNPDGEFEIVYVGPDTRGHVEYRQDGNLSTVDWVVVGDDAFFNATEDFWLENPAGADLVDKMAGRWVRFDAGLDWIADVVARDHIIPEAGGSLHYLRSDSVEGHAAWVFQDEDGAAFSFAAAGDPYLLSFVAAEGGRSDLTELRLTEYGAVTEIIEAPTGEIVDYADLATAPA